MQALVEAGSDVNHCGKKSSAENVVSRLLKFYDTQDIIRYLVLKGFDITALSKAELVKIDKKTVVEDAYLRQMLLMKLLTNRERIAMFHP